MNAALASEGGQRVKEEKMGVAELVEWRAARAREEQAAEAAGEQNLLTANLRGRLSRLVRVWTFRL